MHSSSTTSSFTQSLDCFGFADSLNGETRFMMLSRLLRAEAQKTHCNSWSRQVTSTGAIRHKPVRTPSLQRLPSKGGEGQNSMTSCKLSKTPTEIASPWSRSKSMATRAAFQTFRSVERFPKTKKGQPVGCPLSILVRGFKPSGSCACEALPRNGSQDRSNLRRS